MKTITLITALVLAPAAYADDVAKTDTTKTNKTGTSKTTDAPANGKAAKPAKLTQDDLQVMAHYHTVNLLEIDLGKTASRVGQSQGVKDYGKMMITEHGDDDKAMAAFAKKRGQTIPAEKPMDEAHAAQEKQNKTVAARIKKLEGAEFDTAYITMMIDSHERELANVDTMAAKVKNTELADMVRAKKPVLQHHADAARELQKNANQTSAIPAPNAPTARR